MTTPTMPNQQITLGITSDIGAVAGAFAALFKAGDDLFNILNSPNMLAARQNAAVQAALDKITSDANAALQPGGDLTEVEKDLS